MQNTPKAIAAYYSISSAIAQFTHLFDRLLATFRLGQELRHDTDTGNVQEAYSIRILIHIPSITETHLQRSSV